MAHILIPTDFSVGSLNACAYALDIYGGALNTYTLLHSYMDPLPGYAAMVDMTSVLYAASVEGLAEFSTRFRGLRNGADALVTTEVVYGPLATSLPGVCKRRNIDLIVMGTHGRTGPRLWWLGSVAERVLRDTAVPVLVVHGGDSPALARLAVYAAPGLRGDAAWELARKLAVALGATATDRRLDTVPASDMFADVSMVVVAEPRVHDRVWRTTVGEPLIRSGVGPVLFVPEA